MRTMLVAMAAGLACAAMSAKAQGMQDVTPNDQGVMGADDSASIQNAVDAAAKRGTGKVVIPPWNARTGKPGWTISRSVLLPGDITVVIDNARLVMADDVYANFFRSANVWTEKGCRPEGVLRNIRIIGQGTAVLDGGKANDLYEATSCSGGRPHVRANCPILFQNVVGFEVRNLIIENHRYWGACFCFCRRGRIADLHFVARYDRRNQDGINLRDGCRDVTIENISGQTGDDMIALSAIDVPRDDGYSCWVEGLSPDICHVVINNVSGAAVGHPLIALRNHNGSGIHDITIDNVADTPFEVPSGGMEQKRYAIMRIGNGIYWHSRKSRLGETSRIAVRGVRVAHSVLGVVVNGTLNDSLFSDFHCTGPCASALTTFGPTWGGSGATMENVTIENATIASSVPAPAVFDCSFINPDDHVRNVRLRNCTLVNNDGTATNLDEVVELAGMGSPVAIAACEGIEIREGTIMLARVAEDGKTSGVRYVKSGWFESAPFRLGVANPSVGSGATLAGGAKVKFEVATAPDAGGAPGAWSEFREHASGKSVPLSADGWLRYRVTLFAGSKHSPKFFIVRIGNTYHTRWRLPMPD